jgi:hypothetical protein
MAIPTFHMDQQAGPLAGAHLDGSCGGWEYEDQRRISFLLSVDFGVPEALGRASGRTAKPLGGGPRVCCIGPDEGPGNQRLDKPRLRTGGSRDLSGPLWWRIQAVDGPREAEGDG